MRHDENCTQRYLMPRAGRWSTPDPAHVHLADGGETLNAYHYVAGSMLQARDPLGLSPSGEVLSLRAALLHDAGRDRRAAMLNRYFAEVGVPEGGFRARQPHSAFATSGEPHVASVIMRAMDARRAEVLSRHLADIEDVYADTSLVLAVTSREASSSWYATSRERIDTFGRGGLDHLGRNMERMTFVPASRRQQWVASREWDVQECQHPPCGGTHHVAPAMIPERDQLLAYAGQLRLAEQRLRAEAVTVFGADRANQMLSSMSESARRAWVQLAFGRPYGNAFDANASDAQFADQQFGIRTALQAVQHDGGTMEQILSDPRMARSASVRRARVTAAEAEFVEDFVDPTHDGPSVQETRR